MTAPDSRERGDPLIALSPEALAAAAALGDWCRTRWREWRTPSARSPSTEATPVAEGPPKLSTDVLMAIASMDELTARTTLVRVLDLVSRAYARSQRQIDPRADRLIWHQAAERIRSIVLGPLSPS